MATFSNECVPTSHRHIKEKLTKKKALKQNRVTLIGCRDTGLADTLCILCTDRVLQFPWQLHSERKMP